MATEDDERDEHTGHRFDDALLDFLSGDPAPHLSAADRAEIEQLNTLLADPTLWAEPPADLEDRVVAAITAEAGTVGSDAPAELHSVVEDVPSGVVDDIASGASSVGDFTTDPGATGDTPVIDLATARAARSERTSAGGHRASSRSWRRPGFLVAAAATVAAFAVGAVLIIRALVPSPEFEAAMTGTDLAPGATGSISMTRTDSGWDIRLQATGLPRLDNGQFYQAWLRNADGVLVPIGTFNEGTDVTLWAGVKPSEFPTITITKEAADNEQASSGQRVMTGTAVPR